MSELSRLLLKAFRSLSEEEQQVVVSGLVEARLPSWLHADPPELPQGMRARLLGEGLTVGQVPVGAESGGPWQSVPVRLSTDQHERLKQWCQANNFTMAVVLRGLVARFLDDQAARRPRPTGEAAPPA